VSPGVRTRGPKTEIRSLVVVEEEKMGLGVLHAFATGLGLLRRIWLGQAKELRHFRTIQGS